MNNKLSDSNFREEELFRRFLEKEKNHSDISIFDEDFNSEDITFDTVLTNDDTLKEKSNNQLPKTKENYKGFLGKIKFAFDFVTDKHNVRMASVFMLCVFLGLTLVINLITPSKAISQMENRNLSQFPKFSLSAIADGSFGRNFENYIADQFFGRNYFVSAKRKAETLIGKKENHGILIGKDGYLIENSADLTRKNIK